MGLIIDSSVFIAMGRLGRPVTGLIETFSDELIMISSITASELLVGVHRADTPQRRRLRANLVEEILTLFGALPFDLATAREHARIAADLSSRGQRIHAHDLIIAATAMVNGHDVLTDNLRDFGRVPNLVVRKPDW
ncbi:MAG: PIN domain-containing protein [Thermomicrobiales bacterium]